MFSRETVIGDALKMGNALAMQKVLAGFGMHCLHCVLASGETIEQAAYVHGIDPDVMVAALEEAAVS
ncbi:MAG: DUF1858 domain-containing protein [Christensenellaceae bacterium]|jgi:hybrid cluster-associated redox disulfide protein|nr:DUF1858 domain-containing protein [Christensenellaceae bacterium]